MSVVHTYQSPVVLTIAVLISTLSGCRNTVEPPTDLVEQSYVHTRSSWSPDGTTIAFRATIAGVPGIYLMDSAGTNLRLLHQGEGVGFSWSPDSRWLAFSAFGKIFKIKATGDSLTELTAGPGSIRPSWSPDGSKIAFVLSSIWLLRLDNDSLFRVLTFGDYPSWHPNGNEVIFLSIVDDGSSTGPIYRFESVNIINRNLTTIATFRSLSSCGFSSISPIGNEIAFSLKPSGNLAQIWKVDVTTTTFRKLTDDGGDHPSWNHDGSRIIYTRTQKGDGGLWTMNSDGTDKRRLSQP